MVAQTALKTGYDPSLSARRAWIEITMTILNLQSLRVALRKESVDRNLDTMQVIVIVMVALRKESVDRNLVGVGCLTMIGGSLSARRAWIEIGLFGADTVSY